MKKNAIIYNIQYCVALNTSNESPAPQEAVAESACDSRAAMPEDVRELPRCPIRMTL